MSQDNFDSIWSNLELKIIRSDPIYDIQMGNFIKKVDRQHTIMLLVVCLSLLFESETTTLIKKFVSSAIGKIFKLLSEKLADLEAP